jgi:iron complex outermembrane receptor protein
MPFRPRTVAVGLAVALFVLLFPISATAQITGNVRDPQGRPLDNVTVSIPGSPARTLSDAAGNFTLPLAATNSKLRLNFECAGFYPLHLDVDAAHPAALDVVLTARIVLTQDVAVIEPRLQIPAILAPAATSVVGFDQIESMPRGIAAEEALESVPGLKVDNQADGERVHLSIRGQGILSEHGIRGIQVLLDGIPLNDPSGFAPDAFDVDWSGARDVEVVRGPVAFLYGGGSGGGVISIRTTEPENGTHGKFWSTGGSNGFYKTHGEISGRAHGVSYLLSAARTAGDGYRQHTAYWGNNVFGKLSFEVTPRLRLNVIGFGTGFWNQNAEGLNLAWLARDPRMANPDALTFNEYQQTNRGTGGVTGQWSVSERQRLSFTFYFRRTQYTEPVPSSIDHRAITAPGGSLQYDIEGGSGRIKHHFSAGADLDGQLIGETRFLNLGNAVAGDLVADQSITQNRYAGFATERLSLGSRWTMLASVRVDAFGNRLQDHVGTSTGERNFRRATGRVGVTYHPRDEFALYASWGQGFLPPATEELTTNPAAFGGFNMSLVPATSSGAEIGIRGNAAERLYFDAAFFRLDTSHDFERYRCPQPGAVCYPANRPLETFYANAGNTRRYGLETSLRWLPLRRLALTAAYTYSHFVYTDYTSFVYSGDLTGNRLPNSPSHQLFAEGRLELPRSVAVALGTQAFSRAYIDPTNRTWIGGYGLLQAQLSKGFLLGRTYATFSVHGRNLAAKPYIAFTEPDPDGNSYQPGPLREVFGALQFRF